MPEQCSSTYVGNPVAEADRRSAVLPRHALSSGATSDAYATAYVTVDSHPHREAGVDGAMWEDGCETAIAGADEGVTCHDVAAYIVARLGRLSAMKLQKLVYYSQAWSLVWDERPLFPERLLAWANGPVVRELFEKHRGMFLVAAWPIGKPEKLDDIARETVDKVLAFYGPMNPQQLSDLTHAEEPWRLARQGIPDGERGDREITHESLAGYYGSL